MKLSHTMSVYFMKNSILYERYVLINQVAKIIIYFYITIHRRNPHYYTGCFKENATHIFPVNTMLILIYCFSIIIE